VVSCKWDAVGQAALLLDPGELLGLPGLVVGGRYVGSPETGGYPEPLVGYRAYIDHHQRTAVGGVLYGTYAHGTNKGASYKAGRGGAEAGVDWRATPRSEWLELHLLGSLSATGLSAIGHYCLDADGRYGADCPDTEANPVGASVAGVYPASTGALSLVTGRHLGGVFHGATATISGAIGTAPALIGGAQATQRPYAGAGLTLALAFGAAETERVQETPPAQGPVLLAPSP
jgi:hypothetical protein